MQENTTEKEESKQQHDFPQERMLEFAQIDDGRMILRDVEERDEPLVSIEFSDKIKDMLGEDVHIIGKNMIHAAIHSVMNQQINHWHANVYDEEPEHYS